MRLNYKKILDCRMSSSKKSHKNKEDTLTITTVSQIKLKLRKLNK